VVREKVVGPEIFPIIAEGTALSENIKVLGCEIDTMLEILQPI
jgi:hypothetical protein